MGNVVSSISAGHGMARRLGIPGAPSAGDPAFVPGAAPDFGGEYRDTRRGIGNTYAPYLSEGRKAMGLLGDRAAAGFTMDDFTADPGYQFTLQQGLQSVQNAAGVRGSPFGGQAEREMMQYGTGLANQTYQAAFDRWQTQIQNLAGIAGIGANAAQAKAGNLASLFGSMVGGEANVYGSQAGIESSRVGRGGSFFGAGSNFAGI